MRSDATLASVADSYDVLRDRAYFARYEPTFRASEALVQRASRCLDQIRSITTADLT